MKWLHLAIIVAFFTGCSTWVAPLSTVPSVDLSQYQGSWYEIARYENRFEKGCEGAKATYTLKDSTLHVLNQCYDAKGNLLREAKGKAYSPDPAKNDKLRVSFFWPFYGDYWVLMLADDYRYSVVGDPSRTYLWILSRTPSLSPQDTQTIVRSLQPLGYAPDKLYWNQYP